MSRAEIKQQPCTGQSGGNGFLPGKGGKVRGTAVPASGAATHNRDGGQTEKRSQPGTAETNLQGHIPGSYIPVGLKRSLFQAAPILSSRKGKVPEGKGQE